MNWHKDILSSFFVKLGGTVNKLDIYLNYEIKDADKIKSTVPIFYGRFKYLSGVYTGDYIRE